MTTEYPKRLIEVDLPIARISAHARREKSIRHGHISTLHIWWARRPLAACRAVICAALWPDPADELCPQAFREAAVEQIVAFARRVFPKKLTAEGKLLSSEKHLSFESRGRWEAIAAGTMTLDANESPDMPILRLCLLDFIADFSNWDNSTVPAYLETSRALTQAAHEALGGVPGTRPLVVDPFAGGGSIPLEALRVGADAFASDLNPVAVLLNKVVLEYVPKYGQRLADVVRKWGQWIKEQAEQELAEFYPKDPDGATPIAYLWARTIICEGPTCGARLPLVASLWLGKKPHRPFALRIKTQTNGGVRFEVFSPKNNSDVDPGTAQRGSATCPVCGYTTPVNSVAAQLRQKSGGASDATLFCVATTRESERGRFYREPTDADSVVAGRAAAELDRQFGLSAQDQLSLPDEPLPPIGTLGFRVQRYGMTKWRDLFSPRQALALLTLVKLVRAAGDKIRSEDKAEFADAVQLLLSFNVDKMADFGSSLASWSSPASQETVRQTFARMALPMVWDFAEAYPFAESSGGWLHNLEYLANSLESIAQSDLPSGTVSASDAARHPLPDDSVAAFFTDPPYYDAIPYADLSDFFLVWLTRSLAGSSLVGDLPVLSPKDEECVVDPSKGHDHVFFERIMAAALEEGRRYASPNAVGVIVFAHKSTSGWEAQLGSLIQSGWIVSGSWPIDTERQGRVRANSSAALASSIHLVCRPRENSDGSLREETGEWRDVLSELPKRIHEWMPRLADEGVVGADTIFACLGPALEIFSRYSRVEKASGESVPLREYLEQVWAAVSTEALSMIFKDADAAGLEPDARLTAMWLWTLGAQAGNGNGKADESVDSDRVIASTGYTLEFDAARKIAQGLGIHLEQSESIVEVKGGKARLLPASERTRHLFGKDDATAATARGRKKKKEKQRSLFEELDELEAEAENLATGELKPQAGETVLDRVHQSMILFASGRGEALRRFLVDDGAGNDARFWKLAQSLSALYPQETDEKRWVDGVLARKKGLGL